MDKFKQKLIAFMYGRYGVDELYYGLLALWGVITVVNIFVNSLVLYIVGLAPLFIMMWRSFSRNIAKRRKENAYFLKVWYPIRNWFTFQRDKIKDRKTARYRKCKHCKAIIKLPNKKGKHTVKCPKCGERFDVRI